MKIIERDFGQGYHLITLENENKLVLSISDLGTRIISLRSNDRELVLGFDIAEEHIKKDLYIGTSIGRTAGRTENGRFSPNGKTYQLATDPKTGHNLYGGAPGFELKKRFYIVLGGEDEASIISTATGPGRERGSPGTMDVEIRYILTQDNIRQVTSRGTSNQDTLPNPTDHVYFDLTGDASQPIDQHELWFSSEVCASLRTSSTPIGVKENTTGSAFDFQIPKKLTSVFASDLDQENLVDRIGHSFSLEEIGLDKEVVHLISPDRRVQVDIATDAFSVVIFTADFGIGTPEMCNRKLAYHGGIISETQTAPGTEHFSTFDSTHSKTESIFEAVTESRIKTGEE